MGEKMTRTELAEMISTEVRQHVGTEIATIIRENVAKEVAPLREKVTSWGDRIAAGETGTGGRVLGADGKRWSVERDPALPANIDTRGLALARVARSILAARRDGQGPEQALNLLKQWGNRDLAEEWGDFRAKAMTAGDATAGGFIVPVQYVQDFVAFLRARTVVRKLGAPTIPLPTGTAKMGKATAGSTANYVGESTNAPKTQLATGQLTLSFKKLMALVPVSNDLLRYSSPGADMIVRNDLVAAMSVKEDAAFIRGDGNDGSPRGMRYWAPGANVIAANGTASIQNTASDLGKLMQQLMNANIPMINPVWIMSPRTRNFLMTLITTVGNFIYKDEMAGGTLWGYPFGVTTGVPDNLNTSGAGNNNEGEIYFVDIGQSLIGEAETLTIDASREAAYNDGSTVQSAWSRDETTIRAIAEHDFVMRYDAAVAVLTQVTWSPGSV